MPEEKIEILSVDLLDQYRQQVEDLKRFAKSLRLEFGWHYLLDITWTIQNLGSPDGLVVMDAGAGVGVMQWYLANQGAKVYSVDRTGRQLLPLRYRTRFHVSGMRPDDLFPPSKVITQRFNQNKGLSKLTSTLRELADSLGKPNSSGCVIIYNQDLANLVDIPDNSLDAIVAISALEHNTPDGLSEVVREMLRTLKPGGHLIATLTAARDEDWWHEESKAWCYTDRSLRDVFDFPEETPSNYDKYDEFFATLEECAELRDNLASFYYKSPDNGMPWGIWNPKYQPVGICKRKPIYGHNFTKVENKRQ